MTAKLGLLEQTQGLHSHAEFYPNVFSGQKPQFLANVNIWGDSFTDPLFTDEGQIWCARGEPWYNLTCQILSRSAYSVSVWRRNTLNFAVFGILWCRLLVEI